MTVKIPLGALVAASLLAGACAKRPDNITPRFASSSGYRAMQCEQLNAERMRVGVELQRAISLQRQNANADAAMVIGAVVLWPVLFGLAATTDRTEQIAAMMGERDAMDLVAREKACPAVSTPRSPAAPTQSP